MPILRLASSILSCLLLVGLSPPARAQPAAAGAPLPILLDYQSFWNLPEATRQLRHRIDYEAVVLYYDPGWGVLWLENQGLQFFCNPGPNHWPIRSGDRIRVEGIVFPPQGYAIEDLRFTVVGRSPPPDAALFDGRGDPDRFNERRTRVRGLIERTTETDPTHLQLRIITDGLAVNGIMPLSENDPVPLLGGLIVEAVGQLTLHKDPVGRIQSIDLWIDGPKAITTLGALTSDPRFHEPALSTLQLLEQRPERTVRFVGRVQHSAPGQSLTLADDTSEVVVLSAQDTPVKPGEKIEAIGLPQVRGATLHLRHALWRTTGAGTSPAPAPRLKLRSAAQVLELAPAEADWEYQVELLGVVTWSDPTSPFFYVQDSSRGVCIRSPGPWLRPPPPVGSSVRVIGRTAMGPFAPLVRLDRYELLSGFTLPAPREISLEQLRGGAEEGKLVEVEGYLRAIEREPDALRLQLTGASGEFAALLPADTVCSIPPGAVVRLHGVCTALANERRQLVGIELLVAAAAECVVIEPPPADPFDAPAVSLTALSRFSPLQSPCRRIRTTGRVNYHAPGRLLLLENDDDGLEVLARAPDRLAVGALVEVVGFQGQSGGQPVLREAVFRQLPAAAVTRAPSPAPATIDPGRHNRLVRLDGRLLGAMRLGDDQQLTLRAGDTTFTVLLPASAHTPDLPDGAEVRCTGVYRAQFDEYGLPRAFQLLARDPADLVVLRRPPWLSHGRALALATLLTLGAGTACAWSFLLRRRVRAQTTQIRRQLEHQANLERELQKAAKLESLGLLAGGIAHDFNNLLTVILGNITLARLDERAETAVGDCLTDAERGAQRARDLTQQLLTFAKGGDPHRTAVSLAEVVREAAAFVLRGAKVACDYDFAPSLWVAEVDRGQIGQVIHNLVLNACQAMPDGGSVLIALQNTEIPAATTLPLAPGPYLELVVADTGPGMAPEVLARVFDPYFTTKKAGSGLGLATVHSIVRRHNGHIDVRSQPGRGTAFHIWLPAATAAAPATAAPAHQPLPAVVAGRRILVMDDEADIRRLVTTLLHRMGLEVVAVADGAAAIEAFRTARAAGRPFDLVITDLTVPGGMGGQDAMRTLREIDPSVRAIVSSGYAEDPVLARHRDFGFRGMVRKPYDIEELAACVARVLTETDPASP